MPVWQCSIARKSVDTRLPPTRSTKAQGASGLQMAHPSLSAYGSFLAHSARAGYNSGTPASGRFDRSASPPRMTCIYANRTNPLIRRREHPGRAALDELGTKREHRRVRTRLPRLFAERLLPLGASCREIWTGDHIARPYRSVLLRLYLARGGAIEERQIDLRGLPA